MLESLDNTKSTYVNGIKVSLIKSALRDLKNEIKQMPKDKIERKRPDVIVNLVEKILDFNERLDTTDIPNLESDESAEQKKFKKVRD